MFRILVISGVILILLLFLLHKYQGNHESKSSMHKMIIPYLKGVLYELGSPPDAKKAKLFKKRYNIVIFYQGADTCWTTDNSVFNSILSADSLVPVFNKPVKIDEYIYIKFKIKQGTYWVRSVRAPFKMNRQFALLPLSVVLLLVFSVAYFAIRHILNPVKPLIAGVNEVAKGNFEVNIPSTSHDEFGKLTESFNTMIISIRRMMTQKKQLLYDVSHELRSPITRIKIALEMLPESQSKIDIVNDIAEMETMIDELLESARLDGANGKLQLERVDLTSLINDLKIQYREFRPGIVFHIEGTVGTVSADRQRLRKVIRNILENALKYSSDQPKPVEVNVRPGGDNRVEIEIKDYGKGIDPDQLDHIFEPFYRVDQSRVRTLGGYGLGLFLCKKIIEAHGGTIKAESSREMGTRMIIKV
jgi:signal transduction histidine kinase